MWLHDELTSNEVRLSGEDQLHFTFIPNKHVFNIKSTRQHVSAAPHCRYYTVY